MYQDIYNCICQNTKKEIYYPLCQIYSPAGFFFKFDFQKVDQHAEGKLAIVYFASSSNCTK